MRRKSGVRTEDPTLCSLFVFTLFSLSSSRQCGEIDQTKKTIDFFPPRHSGEKKGK